MNNVVDFDLSAAEKYWAIPEYPQAENERRVILEIISLGFSETSLGVRKIGKALAQLFKKIDPLHIVQYLWSNFNMTLADACRWVKRANIPARRSVKVKKPVWTTGERNGNDIEYKSGYIVAEFGGNDK